MFQVGTELSLWGVAAQGRGTSLLAIGSPKEGSRFAFLLFLFFFEVLNHPAFFSE